MSSNKAKPPVAVGDRIRLVAPMDDPHPITVGQTGTVDWVGELLEGQPMQIGVKWDDGRRLMLLPVDQWELL